MTRDEVVKHTVVVAVVGAGSAWRRMSAVGGSVARNRAGCCPPPQRRAPRPFQAGGKSNLRWPAAPPGDAGSRAPAPPRKKAMCGGKTKQKLRTHQNQKQTLLFFLFAEKKNARVHQVLDVKESTSSLRVCVRVCTKKTSSVCLNKQKKERVFFTEQKVRPVSFTFVVS